MLASRIMSKRTTFTTEDDDYLTLEREAERRGVPVAHMIREAVAEYVVRVRAENRPRFGVAHGPGNLSQLSVDDEDAPAREHSPWSERDA